MKRCYAVLQDGEQLFLDEAVDRVPSTIYATKEFVDICELLSNNLRGLSTDERKIYVNLLIKHSRLSKQLIALYYYSRLKSSVVAKIVSRVNVSLLPEIFPEADFECFQGVGSSNLLDKSHAKNFIFKSVLHRIYRIASTFSKKAAKPYSIRSWVEISESMYGDFYKDANILIYPFVLNVKRHIKYIRSVVKRFDDVHLMGLPYRVFHAGINIINPKDIFYVKEEFRAYQLHGYELSNISSLSVKTSDEFEAGSFIMCKTLRESGIDVDNSAHGISFACVYTAYSNFIVYNDAQLKYYSANSVATNFTVKQRRNAPADDSIVFEKKFQPCIIAIHNPYGRYGMMFEHNVQVAAFDKLTKLSEIYNVPFYIKVHPNAVVDDHGFLSKWSSAIIVRKLSEVRYCSPTFINISSAAYYDFCGFGPFIFIDDGVVPMSVMFDDSIVSIKPEQLDEFLPKYFQESYWLSALEKFK